MMRRRYIDRRLRQAVGDRALQLEDESENRRDRDEQFFGDDAPGAATPNGGPPMGGTPADGAAGDVPAAAAVLRVSVSSRPCNWRW